jgi:peptidyl-prolyl cis-trans isomerase-like 4
MLGMRDTIGSQFLITLDSGPGRALDGLGKITDLETEASVSSFLSLGKVVEDDNDVLGKINEAYCDRDGRPYADIRIVRMFILDDPFEDPDGLDQLMISYGVKLMKEDDLEESDRVCARWLSSQSPTFDRPPGERIEARIRADEIDLNDEGGTAGDRVNRIREKEARSQAVILEMVGDLPSADIKPPENVLFVCKLNPVTEDEDLELIFSRFDPNARAEIIRDPETGQSLQYAFIEFTTPEQCNEAYFKMNNTLIDDRRIKVDFSQSVAKIWNKYSQKRRGAFDERPNIQTDRNRGFHRPNHSDNVVDNQIIAQNGPISLRRNFNHHAGAAGDRRTSKHDYRHSSHHFHENDVDEKVRDIRNHRDDHGHKSHHHKSEERRRERIRSRSHDRGSDSDQSNDSSSHRHRKSHRKHKRKHKSHRKS